MENQVSGSNEQNKGVVVDLKEIAIVSGKGGTGKTTITASFAALASNSVIADCDVDAPDLHMLLHPEVVEKTDFNGPKLAEIDREKCVEFGLCEQTCRFGAIKDLEIDPIHCEGCGACEFICPSEAITLKERVSGEAMISKTKYGMMAHALLFPGGANSGKLVSIVRQNAKEVARKEQARLILIDGPPGIGCPVIASVAGVDLAIVVTEPTISGIHDLKRALQLLSHFGITALICINKYDLNQKNTQEIEKFCVQQKVDVVGKVPFDRVVTTAMVSEAPVVEYSPESEVSRSIMETWKKVIKKTKPMIAT